MIKQQLFLLICVFIAQITFAQNYHIEIVTSNQVNTSIRGLAALNDSIIWASGSNGYVAKSINGGKTWSFSRIPGMDSAELRDIEVLDEKTIIVMSSVQPAAILKSTDGGVTWKKVFEDTRKEAFLDAMDFAGKKGICLGDPINGKFLLLQTKNKGNSWSYLETCAAPDSVAAFAASGSTIALFKKGKIRFATGGNKTMLVSSENNGKNWTYYNLPLQKGAPSKGIFSIDFLDPTIGAVAGGDYLMPKDYTGNFTMIVQDNITWKSPLGLNPNGYRSCIKFIESNVLIACGTSGVDMAKDLSWFNISLENFNVIVVTPESKNVILAGNNGKIGILVAGN
jgi:photosystem II stability/assembly factor-like uncharacterized protein